MMHRGHNGTSRAQWHIEDTVSRGHNDALLARESNSESATV